MSYNELILAGFGGQGILSAGKVVAVAGMLQDKQVSWYPSYGAEKRGGTANCHVVVADGFVGAPIVNKANSLIVMNTSSLERFENIVAKDGVIITDSSLVKKKSKRKDIKLFEVPATQMASDMGNAAFANVILLGKLIAVTKIVSKESLIEAIKNVLPEKKQHLVPYEIKALEMGMNY